MTTSTLSRFVAINSALSTSDDYNWHVFDREARQVAVWHTSQDRAEAWASDYNADHSRRTGLAWTELDDIDDQQILDAVRAAMIQPGSAEFWTEAQIVADAAGYCEVFDRLAFVLGGPVRDGARDGLDRDHFRIVAEFSVPKGQTEDLYTLRQQVRNALNDVSGLRYSTEVKAKRTEPAWATEIRQRVAELKAERERRAAE